MGSALDNPHEAGLLSAAILVEVDLGGVVDDDPSKVPGCIAPPIALLGPITVAGAWTSEAKRTTVTLQPSSVIPDVEPSQPSASAAS